MNRSNITIYKSKKLSKSLVDRTKRMIIDNIDAFLENLPSSDFQKIEFLNYQYIKNDFHIEIKLDYNQDLFSLSSYAPNILYAKIETFNDEELQKPCYYFVDKIEWRARQTCKLYLTLDVLNTYKVEEDFTLAPESLIKREHKNRLVKRDLRDLQEIEYARKIDEVDENLSPILYKTTESYVADSNHSQMDWFLIYRNQEDTTASIDNPVLCYLCGSKPLTLTSPQPQEHGEIHAYDLLKGYFYVIESSYNFKRPNGTYIRSDTNGRVYSFCRNANNKITLFEFQLVTGSFLYSETSSYLTSTEELDYIQCVTANIKVGYSKGLIKTMNFSSGGDPYVIFDAEGGVGNDIQIDSIDSVDRTDSKLLKIIKLPYAPTTNPKIDYNWKVASYKVGNKTTTLLQLNNLNTTFLNEIESPVSPIKALHLNSLPNKYHNRNDDYESKLYSSEFYYMKAVYDSFDYVFNLENYRLSQTDQLLRDTKLKINFNVTSTINSRFLFSYPQFEAGNFNVEDYSAIMPVTRNNEITLYNNSYFNYIRTGYNYDVKNKIPKNAINIINTPEYTGDIVTSIIQTGKNLLNTVSNAIAMEREIKRKKIEYQSERTTTSGSDDIDLMSVYSKNRLSLIQYECSEKVKALVSNLFFFNGYASNRMLGSGTINQNSRAWFNYIKADISFSNFFKVTSEEIKTEIIRLWSEGVTFFHRNLKENSTTEYIYDFEQVKENAETNIETIVVG